MFKSKASKSFFFLLLAVPTFFCVAALRSCPKPSKNFSLVIVTANIREQQSDETNRDVAYRLFEIGKFISNNFPFWSVIALNELAADKLQGRIPGIGPVKHRAKKLHCPYDDSTESLESINCLERGLRRLSDPSHLKHQKGELGVIASRLWFNQLLINDKQFYARLIGPERNGGIQRRLIASRISQKNKNKNMLIVSTHLNHAGSVDERQEELRDLITNIKAIFTPGDLTPILVGDFNCHKWKRGLRSIMYEDFMLADTNSGVDHVFIGRPQSFPENGGILLPTPTNSTVRIAVNDDHGNRLSDHPFISVTLEYNVNNQPTFLPPSVINPGEGCMNQ